MSPLLLYSTLKDNLDDSTEDLTRPKNHVIPDSTFRKLKEVSTTQCSVIFVLGKLCSKLSKEEEVLKELQGGLSIVNEVLKELTIVIDEIDAANGLQPSTENSCDEGNLEAVSSEESESGLDKSEPGLDKSNDSEESADNNKSSQSDQNGIDTDEADTHTQENGEAGAGNGEAEEEAEMIECQVDIMEMEETFSDDEDDCQIVFDDHGASNASLQEYSSGLSNFVSKGRKRKGFPANNSPSLAKTKRRKMTSTPKSGRPKKSIHEGLIIPTMKQNFNISTTESPSSMKNKSFSQHQEKLDSPATETPSSRKNMSFSQHQVTQFRCTECVLVYPDRSKMKLHLLSHYYRKFDQVLSKARPYSCPECKKSNRDFITLLRHYAFKHKKLDEVVGFNFQLAVEQCCKDGVPVDPRPIEVELPEGAVTAESSEEDSQDGVTLS